MQGFLGMMEELSASQKKKVSSFKMYYQYAVDTEYVYYTDEHIPWACTTVLLNDDRLDT